MSGRRDPFKEIEELFEQLNEGFADVGRDLGEEFGGGGIKVDVADADDEIVVTADVPGFEPDDIDDEIAPVAWGECKDYSQTDNAAIVVAGTAAAASASASAASCAGAGAAGGAGGGAC